MNSNRCYKPQLLVLAPEDTANDDANTLSLVSHLLEMGVALDLDESYSLPTRPPADLSAYSACLFPDNATQYDAALDSFYHAGGFVPYFKYYPVAKVFSPPGVHHFAGSYGRDAYFFHVANALIEAGLTLNHPSFLQWMGSRPLASIVSELRASFFRYDRPIDVWRSFGDPIYTMMVNNLALAEATRDAEWLNLVRRCLHKMCESKAELLTRRTTENQLPDTVDSYVPIMGELFMASGRRFEDLNMIAAGLELTEFFLSHCGRDGDIVFERWMRFPWSECFAPVPALYQAWAHTGDRRYRALADATLRHTAETCQAENGLWHHWMGLDGRKGSFWSRGTQWPILWMTRSLEIAEPDSEAGALMLDRIRKTFDGLRQHQSQRGPWRLVIDEPDTRLESTATAAIVYCYDRLRSRGLIDDRHADMIERAFTGLKTLYYRSGVASACRGTGIGTPDYYRTRPMGHYANSLFGAACAARLQKGQSS